MPRPTDYRPEYCDLVIHDMGKGYSLTAFCGLIGTNRQTIKNWKAAHPEFEEAVSQAKAKQLRSWETRGIKVADGEGGVGAAPMVSFALCNLGEGEWKNKQDHTFGNPDGTNMENKTVIVLPSNGRD